MEHELDSSGARSSSRVLGRRSKLDLVAVSEDLLAFLEELLAW